MFARMRPGNKSPSTGSTGEETMPSSSSASKPTINRSRSGEGAGSVLVQPKLSISIGTSISGPASPQPRKSRPSRDPTDVSTQFPTPPGPMLQRQGSISAPQTGPRLSSMHSSSPGSFFSSAGGPLDFTSELGYAVPESPKDMPRSLPGSARATAKKATLPTIVPPFALGAPTSSPAKDSQSSLSVHSIFDNGDPSSAGDLPFPAVTASAGRHNHDEPSLAPWRYVMSIPGKNVRDQLIDAFQYWLEIESGDLVLVKQIVGYLHTASLLIDDVEDASPQRRGFQAAHIVYGDAKTINSGNYVYFIALEKILTLQSTDCVEVFASEMCNLHRGQGRDIWWREDGYTPTRVEYEKMVLDKTGGLFRLAVRLMQVLALRREKTYSTVGADSRPASTIGSPQATPKSAGVKRVNSKEKLFESSARLSRTGSFAIESLALVSTMTRVADDMAIYFQVRDDLLNLASADYHAKKGFCEDITEGKFSFPAVLAFETLSKQGASAQKTAMELLDILHLKTTDRKLMCRALSIMAGARAFSACVLYLKSLKNEIVARINELGGNPKLQGIIEALSKDVDVCSDEAVRSIVDSLTPEVD